MPLIILSNQSNGFISTKISRKPSIMLLLNEFLPHWSHWNAQLTSFGLDYEIQPLLPIMCNIFCTSFPCFTKFKILWIQIIEFLESNHLNLHLCHHRLSSTRSIYNSIRIPTPLFLKKSITMSKLITLQMSLVQFNLTIQILQMMMITIQNKCPRKKIVSPLLQCLNYNIKFLIINDIFSFGNIQILTKIRNMFTVLS